MGVIVGNGIDQGVHAARYRARQSAVFVAVQADRRRAETPERFGESFGASLRGDDTPAAVQQVAANRLADLSGPTDDQRGSSHLMLRQ